MSERHITLAEGDTLIIKAVPRPIEPRVPTGELEVLLNIGGINIYRNADASYICFVSDLDVCNDGSGPAHGDPYHQPQTAYYNQGKFLNADTDRYIVIPPQIRAQVPGVVMGAQARLTNLETKATSPAVTGEIGPKDKTGEAAYCLAKLINPTITHNAGDENLIYLYELWPDVPATVNQKTYKLEPA
jgi:hypothetical protein